MALKPIQISHEETDTLLNHVAAYLAEKNQVPYVVHRLDKETSGAIVFAKILLSYLF